MESFISVIHIVAVVLMIIVVLLQSGKGAEVSASFSGSSQTLFGSTGGNFFTRLTSVLAAIFMVTSILLYSLSKKTGIFEEENVKVQVQEPQPIEKTKTESTDAESKANSENHE